MKLSTILPVLVIALAACANNPEPDSPMVPPSRTETPAATQQTAKPASTAFDAIGNYEFTTTVEGQNVGGTIDILKKSDGTLGGRVATDMTGEIPVTSITVEGMKVTINANMPDGALGFTMEFKNANEFTGSWSYAGMGGAFTGKRKV